MANYEGTSSSSGDEAPVESLIQGRAKRSTAGLNMSALLNAEADDDLALLFQEVDDDNEFSVAAGEEGGEDDEMRLDSSSDDEDDPGPNTGADDLEGEKQLEKEEKAEKKKRRAREDLRYKIASKKVKIDPTAVTTTPAPRPKKKSERVSWIPTPEDGPTRSSSRRQTMQNKQLTHARLKDSEEKRIRLIATMEEAAKRKAKFKPKEMTQAERLAEAERVERLNSKLLNRWEEMEKKKAEERRAKIEALQNRRLEGPVMSYWSGIATWVDGRLTRVGKVDIHPKPEKEDTTRKKSKKSEKENKNATEPKSEDAAGPAHSQMPAPTNMPERPSDQKISPEGETKPDKVLPPQGVDTNTVPDPMSKDTSPLAEGTSNVLTITEAPTAAAQPPQPPATAPNEIPSSNEHNISIPQQPDKPEAEKAHDIQDTEGVQKADCTPTTAVVETPKEASKEVSTSQVSSQPASQPAPETSIPNDYKQQNQDTSLEGEGKKLDDIPKDSESAASGATQPHNKATHVKDSAPALAPVSTSTPIETPAQGENSQPLTQEMHEEADIHVDHVMAVDEASLQPPPPPVVEQTGRCLTVLENFDDKTAQSREFGIYFNAKKLPRLTKISSSLCVITSLPSRYRDPETSLPFANSYAYHEIRHTSAQKYSWSPMLGCYVGPVGTAARGVPSRFLSASKVGEDNDCENKSSNENEPAPGKSKGHEISSVGNSADTPNPTPPAPPAPVSVGTGDAMEIDSK